MGEEDGFRLSGVETVNRRYLETARLLVKIAPIVFTGDMFALKGGTAINLFVRDMPRLSVDLDLVFRSHAPTRSLALAQIDEVLHDVAAKLKKANVQSYFLSSNQPDVEETKLLIRDGNLQVKVEVNTVLRGTVYPVRTASLTQKAREVLKADIDLPIVSFEDLYAGKLVAALDRQHPRDLFDVMQLYMHEGLTPGIRRAFVVYLVSHNRPIHEVLFPRYHDIRQDYEHTFRGMTTDEVGLDALLNVRDRLAHELPRFLDESERGFLISVAKNKPNWDILGMDHVKDMPAVLWKLRNINDLASRNPQKFIEQYQILEERLKAI